jgi:spore germination protein YaaH
MNASQKNTITRRLESAILDRNALMADINARAENNNGDLTYGIGWSLDNLIAADMKVAVYQMFLDTNDFDQTVKVLTRRVMENVSTSSSASSNLVEQVKLNVYRDIVRDAEYIN